MIKERKHNYFYKITNLINGKFYYGIHSTDKMNDSYLGSGKIILDAIEKYGRKNFIKEIIADYPTRKEASDHEKQVVTQELIELEECYNLKTGGDNDFVFGEIIKKQLKESKRKFRESDAYVEFQRKLCLRMFNENNPFWNKTHTEESKSQVSLTKILKYNTEEFVEYTNRGIEKRRQNNTLKHKDEVKTKIAESLIGNDRCKGHPCSIDGKLYRTVTSARLDYPNVSGYSFRKRLLSDKDEWKNWFYI